MVIHFESNWSPTNKNVKGARWAISGYYAYTVAVTSNKKMKREWAAC